MSILRKWRWANKVYAKLLGFYWLPCPICGEYFGGHEWNGHSIYDKTGRGDGVCYKKSCAEEARKRSSPVKNGKVEHPVYKHPIRRQFERIEHYKQWPSDDPADHPLVTYQCKLCEWQCGSIVYGYYADKEEDIIEELRDHLLFDHILTGILGGRK